MILRLLVVGLVASGCVTTRTVAIDPYVALAEPPLATRWALTNVAVLPPTNPQLSNHRFATMLQQLEGHLRSSLASEVALGEHVADPRDAEYAVELELRLVEGAALNGYYGVSLGEAVAGPLVGAAVGTVIAGPAAPAGVLIGAVVGGSVALIGSTLTPSQTYSGQLEATVTVRRARDGVEVAKRTSRSEWSALLNAYDVEAKLATAAGHAVPDLEREVSRTLRSTFSALAAPRLTLADPERPAP
jgi:hypothetical protein